MKKTNTTTNIATTNRNYEDVKARVQAHFNVTFNQPRLKATHARMIAHNRNVKTISAIKNSPAYIAQKEEKERVNREAYLNQFEEDLKYILEYSESHKAILTPFGEETVKNYACRTTYAPRLVRLPMDDQKALFKDYNDGKIDKFTVLEKLTIPARLILKWALKHNFSLYLDLVFPSGNKPVDLEDLAHEGLLALFEYEALTPYYTNDDGVNVVNTGFTLEMYKFGLSIEWLDDNCRKVFYSAITNAVYKSKGGRCTLKSVKGHKEIKFYDVVYYNNDEIEIPKDDPELIRLVYGDGTKESALAMHADFIKTLTDGERKVLDYMFIYGTKALPISKELGGKEKGFSQYKVSKILIPAIVEKFNSYRKKESRKVTSTSYATFDRRPNWGTAYVSNINTANIFGWHGNYIHPNYKNILYNEKPIAVSLGETIPTVSAKTREIKGLTVKA